MARKKQRRPVEVLDLTKVHKFVDNIPTIVANVHGYLNCHACGRICNNLLVFKPKMGSFQIFTCTNCGGKNRVFW